MMTRNKFYDYMERSTIWKLQGFFEMDEIHQENALNRFGESARFLTIQSERLHIRTAFNLDDMYNDYLLGRRENDLLKEIICSAKRACNLGRMIDHDRIRDFNAIRDLLRIRVFSRETAKTLPKDHVQISRKYYNIVFYISYSAPDGGNATIPVSEEVFGQWRADKDTLLSIALDNQIQDGVLLVPLSQASVDPEVMKKRNILAKDMVGPLQPGVNPLFLLTNNNLLYGASLIENQKVLRMIYDRFQSGYYILPSSIHELMILPEDGPVDGAWLSEMVSEINETDVCPEERLCNMAFFYDGKNGKVANAAAHAANQINLPGSSLATFA